MFLRLTMDLTKLDPKLAQKLINQGAEVQMRNAVRAFIRAAVQKIPVQTGMARGSFLHLGRILRVNVPINPTKTGKYYHAPAKGRYKTKELGARLTTFGGNTLGTVVSVEGNKLNFAIDTRIFHLTLNDLVGSSGTGPWGAFEAGRLAFINYLEKHGPDRMPDLVDYTVVSRLSVGRGGITKKSFKPERKQRKIKNG